MKIAADLSRDSLVSQRDLADRNIINNHTTLRRYQQRLGFPTGFLISPGARRWTWGEVLDWIAQRRELTKGQKHKPPKEAAHVARKQAAIARAKRKSRRRKRARVHAAEAEALATEGLK
jgi:hypothetical protein